MLRNVLCFFVIFSLSCGIKGIIKTGESSVDSGLISHLNPALKPFYFGVASGDPDSQSVVLWTRITPEGRPKTLKVFWRISPSEDMIQAVDSGEVHTSPDQDYTVKPIARNLQASTVYYYQFFYRSVASVIGRTKTAPASGSNQLKFAVVSCNNYEAGYFNGFARIAELDDLDAVIHLGDYIYEYEPGRYGNKNLSRSHQPPKELITLADYRTRFAQYRLDNDLARLHQMVPFINIWDDHEIANNAFATGAANHQKNEGSFLERKSAAQKAFYEWLPVRESPAKKLYRTIKYGSTAQWIMLDERLEARTAPLGTEPKSENSVPSMLGETQKEWLFAQLSATDCLWSFIGNQVIFSPVIQNQVGRKPNQDAWDGYTLERKSILEFIYEHQLNNVVFLSGDSHSSWAFEVPLTLDDYRQNRRTIAVELGTPSITSANTDERIGLDSTLWVESELKNDSYNPHLKYVNLHDHGYLVLTVRNTEILAEWRYVPQIDEPYIQEFIGHRVRIIRGIPRII